MDGIYITCLNPQGAAAQHGGILEGDRILEVDGQSLGGMENMEAAAILRNSGNLVKLVLARKKKASSHGENLSVWFKGPLTYMCTFNLQSSNVVLHLIVIKLLRTNLLMLRWYVHLWVVMR